MHTVFAKALIDHGAKKVSAYCVHPVLSGNAIENIMHSSLDEVVVTDTIPLSKAGRNCHKIRVVSLAEMIANAINAGVFT